MKHRNSLWIAPILVLSQPLLATSAVAGGVSAGSLIQNTAQATYETADGTETVDSNTVSLRVEELLDVTVATLDSGPLPTRPGTEVLTFEVTNTGNGPEAYTLTASPTIAGNVFETTIEAIAVDTNSNGVYDEGIDEILPAPATTAEIAADDALTVFVIVTVPGTVADTETSEVQLLAEATTGTGAPGTTFAGAGADGSNAIVGTSGADDFANGQLTVSITSVSLDKSAVVADPFGGTSPIPGAVITYSISATVEGSASVSNLLVNDPFPADTTYQPGTLTLDGSALTDASGDDAGEATATGISVDLGTVAGGTSQTVTFDVKIDE